jgi:rubredoxin
VSEMCVYCGAELDEDDAYGSPEGPICSEACYEAVLIDTETP